MKTLIDATLKATPLLQAEVDRRIWGSGTLGRGNIPPNPKKPYVLYKELQISPFVNVQETSRSSQRTFEFYINDARGSFTKINKISNLIREALLPLEGQRSPSGVFCLRATWGFDSQEFEDNEYDVNIKFVRMNFVCSG